MLTGLTRTLSRWSCERSAKHTTAWQSQWHYGTHLLAGLCVEQDPTQLDDLGRVLGHVHAVLVAGGRDVDDDVAVELRRGSLNGGHGERYRGRDGYSRVGREWLSSRTGS